MSYFKRILVATLPLLVMAGCTPSQVSDAQKSLTLHYIEQGIYSPVSCRSKEINNEYFVRCTSVGGTVGGLYVISSNDETLVIHPVNGKAIEHSKGLTNVGSVAKDIDIPTVLQLF